MFNTQFAEKSYILAQLPHLLSLKQRKDKEAKYYFSHFYFISKNI